MKSFPLWADRLYNKPLALSRFENESLCKFAEMRIMGSVPDRIGADTLALPQMRAMADEATHYSDTGRKPFAFRGDVAVIRVFGKLIQRGDIMDAESGLTGYNRVLTQFRAAARDPDIKGVITIYNTPGGETSGMIAAAEEMASLSKSEGGKPCFAYLDDMAASAGYVLACTADRIFGRREVFGGSIAAIMNMIDKSKAYEKIGLEPVVIRAAWADRKALGQEGEKIDSDLIAKMQEIVDERSDQIAEFVAAMRGVSEKKIKDLRGDIFTGNDLVKFGLMDDIASEQEVFAEMEREIARG